jgi:hypothetical protein
MSLNKKVLEDNSELAWGVFCNLMTIGLNCKGDKKQAALEACYFLKNVFDYNITRHSKWKDLETEYYSEN